MLSALNCSAPNFARDIRQGKYLESLFRSTFSRENAVVSKRCGKESTGLLWESRLVRVDTASKFSFPLLLTGLEVGLCTCTR